MACVLLCPSPDLAKKPLNGPVNTEETVSYWSEPGDEKGRWSMASANRTDTSTARQILTLRLGEDEYGLDILRVREIKGYSLITPIPNAPAYVKGVMNLRGTVVPVVGLRERFGLPTVGYDRFTVIVIVTVGARIVGLVVDAVSDVIDLGPDDVEPTPEFGAHVDTSMLTGVAKREARLVMLLDVERLVLGAIGADLPQACSGLGAGQSTTPRLEATP
jgi:purine-binding chemotaxis protein CheW